MPRYETRRTKAPKVLSHKAVLYARVSSKEQDREGFSIDAQMKLLRNYAAENDIRIAEEFIDVETAKVAGRTQFNAMLGYLRRHPSVDTILVEKTDRLYRNLRDWVTIDDIEIDVHLVKEGTVISQESRSSEKFMHGIKVLMAKNYVDNLSEETRKGMLEKAEQGIWPTVAPIGYRNTIGTSGKKIIGVDPDMAPLVQRLFEWYGTGLYSLKEASRKAVLDGMVYRKSGKPIGTSTVHKMLRSRIYTGEFEWLGKRYQGTHEPLISVELWSRVQGILDGRHTKRVQGVEKDFLFTGLVHCGHCGCLLVGDIKKQKYIYYRCSHAKRKCPDPYVREEALVELFREQLAPVDIDAKILGWLKRALKEASDSQVKDHELGMRRLEAEQLDIRERMKSVARQNAEGVIDDHVLAALMADYKDEERKIARDLEMRLDADLSFIDEGMTILTVAKGAMCLFDSEDLYVKKRVLATLLSNSSFKGGDLTVSYRKPFDLIVKKLPRAALAGEAFRAEKPKTKKWLPE
ncbi:MULTISPECIES: recombinase family protein [unclassified Sphingomonas]|uniref:recombinase family protein n=1 Tax=unclassified Sphingomonas TaxID=196159 RepID=UPI001F37B71E|nr:MULTISPECIES: recombinase family protein [unclassified Sphingomonas]